jgi:hypothetical protein
VAVVADGRKNHALETIRHLEKYCLLGFNSVYPGRNSETFRKKLLLDSPIIKKKAFFP